MSMRAWVRPVSSTVGVAAAAGAAQLGVAYGFAILLWSRDFTDPGDAAWTANLTWVCWLSATAVVLGAMVGGRLARTAGLPRSYLTQAAVVLGSAVGALVTVPLVAVPARHAELVSDSTPASTAARIALVGVVLGAVVSVGVLLGRPLAWNVIAMSGWLWLLALVSVLVTLWTGGEPDATRLAVWSTGAAPGWFLVMTPMLLAALGMGAAIAWYAKREGRNRVAVAVCGAPGPVLVAVAYLVAGPGSRPETSEQFLPYLAAPYMVLAGLLGSLLVAAIERPDQADDDTPGDVTGQAGAGAPPEPPAAAPDPDSADPPTSLVQPEPTQTSPAHPAPPSVAPEPAPQPPPDRPSPRPHRPWSLRRWSGTSESPEPPGTAESQWSAEHPPAEPPRSVSVEAPEQPAPSPRTQPLPAIPVPASPPPEPAGDADQTSTQTLPAVPVPAAEDSPGRHEWDDDERWLEQIKGDPVRRSTEPLDRPHPTGPATRPRPTGWEVRSGPLFEPDDPDATPKQPRRWSLFGDDVADDSENRPDQHR